jgi:tetratricopeptide (TPR) repeat protein
MRPRSASPLLALMLAAMPLLATGADQYWAYSYQRIDVTAAGDKKYAMTIAHNLHRLDLALSQVMVLPNSDWRPPTHVYVVPHEEFARLREKNDGMASVFIPSAFRNDILIDRGAIADNAFFGAYFGWTGSLLANSGLLRFPYWYRQGLAEVFAASTIDGARIQVGTYVQGRVNSLRSGIQIPLKTLLRIKGNDPQLKSLEFSQAYSAQCWFLVHLIVIDRQYTSNFEHYFSQLNSNVDEDKAFAESFSISYDDLDKWYQLHLRDGRIHLLQVNIPDEVDNKEPLKLGGAEANGRLAVYASEHFQQLDSAVAMAQEALSAEPANQDALYALAADKVRQASFSEALSTAQKLCGAGAVSNPGIARCAELYRWIAAAVLAKHAELELDGPTIAQQAQQFYEKAIALDPEDLGSWSGMAELLADSRNTEEARKFLPRAAHALALYSHSGSFAAALARMCANTGDYNDALELAKIWLYGAPDDYSHDAAAAFISSVKGFMERRSAAGAEQAK